MYTNRKKNSSKIKFHARTQVELNLWLTFPFHHLYQLLTFMCWHPSADKHQNRAELGFLIFMTSSVDDCWTFMKLALKVSQSGRSWVTAAAIHHSSRGLTWESLFIGLQDNWLRSVFVHNSPRAHLVLPRLGNNPVGKSWGAIRGHLIVPTHSPIKTRTMLGHPVVTKQGALCCPNSPHPSVKTTFVT